MPQNLVPFITQTAIGKREILTVFGNDYDTHDGTCLRDYIHVVDLANAHSKALSFLIKKKKIIILIRLILEQEKLHQFWSSLKDLKTLLELN